MSKVTKRFTEAMRAAMKQTTTGYDTTAEVKRIEGGTAWVHIPGGVDETPVKLTIAAKVGDTVQVRVSGGSAWLVGNATAPPTDDKVAIQAKETAEKAGEANKYITKISGYDGVTVHDANDMKNFANVNAEGLSVYTKKKLASRFIAGAAEFYKSDGETLLGSFGSDPDMSGSILRVGAGEGYVRAFDLLGGIPTDLIMYNGPATYDGTGDDDHSVPYIYFKGIGEDSEVSIGIQGYFKNGQFWRGPNDSGNEIIIDTDGIEMTGIVDTSSHIGAGGHITAGTRFVSEYTYSHAGGGTNANLYVNQDGNITKTAGSSRRYKTDIDDADREIFDPHALYSLPFRQFRYKDGYFGEEASEDAYTKLYQGFIAEEVQELYPSAAVINKDGSVETWSDRELIPPMLALIQDQNRRIEKLEAELEILKCRKEQK